jgi:hypothetical protein
MLLNILMERYIFPFFFLLIFVHLKNVIMLCKIIGDWKKQMTKTFLFFQGDDIYVVIPNDINEKFVKEISENNTYTFQNFQVLKNDEQFKLSEHKYKVRFNGATIVKDVNAHNIPDVNPKVKDFAEIHAGKWREDVLYSKNLTSSSLFLHQLCSIAI